MKATIKDVAKRANVSTATVSLVINNHKRISTPTRKKVLDAIEILNYHPSRTARGLVSKRTGNIGFILREDHFSKSEPFYTKVFLGTEFQARDHELYVLLTTVKNEYTHNTVLPRFVLERNVDGIIIAGKVPQGLIDELKTYPIPLVFADYYPREGNYSVALIDNIAGGRQATTHLISKGHRKIAFIGGDIDHPSISERLQGYKLAMAHAGLSTSTEWVFTQPRATDLDSGYRATERIIKNDPSVTAIFSCNDAMGIGAIKYLKEQGLQVPGDISIVGFDDIEMSSLLDPPLTTIRVPKEEIGIHAMSLMSQAIQSTSAKPLKILVSVEIVERKSTRPL